jgi:quinolinate synthase
MAQDFPNKKFYLAKDKMICYNMKKNTIELIKYVLEHLDDPTFEVNVPSEIAKRALNPIEKMLRFS